MLVKICGIRSKKTAHIVTQAGADFIGFVFAPSKRKISPSKAAEIARTLPNSIKKVGVFVNESLDYMMQTAEFVGLDVIQLHGDEPPSIMTQIPYETIKAFPINEFNEQMFSLYPATYYLLDSPSEDYRGGSGKPFDWNTINRIHHHHNFILAGGLTPENVQEAIQTTNPVGVDVSSGVETNGKKDLEKIKQFILNAKG